MGVRSFRHSRCQKALRPRRNRIVVASPTPTAIALRPAQGGLRCGVRPQRQRDERRQRHS